MIKIDRKKRVILIVIFGIMALISLRNLIITGNITGVQKTVKIGFLKSSFYSFASNRTLNGLSIASSPPFLGKYRFEISIRNDTDLNSSVNYFVNRGIKILFAISEKKKIIEIMNMTEKKKILMFSPSGRFSFIKRSNYTFFLRDFFLTPNILLAYAAINEFNIKNAGIIYMMEPEADYDGSTNVFAKAFSSMGGSILFKTTYYVENKSNETEILNLVNSTKPEAVVFLGHGTTYEDFFELMPKVRSVNETMKIFSFGLGSKGDYMGYTEVPSILNGIIFVEHVYYEPKTPIGVPIRNYPFLVGAYSSMEILKGLLDICGDDTTCLQEKLHNETFDTVIGKVKFRENGVIIRPYLLYEIKEGKGVSLKEYTLDDIEKIANDYGLNLRSFILS